MKERPILFSTDMVKAILDGKKSQTRRVIKPTQSEPKVPPLYMEPWVIGGEQETDKDGLPCWVGTHPDYPTGQKWFSCPYGLVGDRLWVKETWQAYTPDGLAYSALSKEQKQEVELFNWAIVDKATSPELKREGDPWIPSIFMPRWASRITLEITDVRVQRIQDISEYDAEQEGVKVSHYYCDEGEFPAHRCDPIGKFRELWDSINAKRGYRWEQNPWVWVIEFRRIER